ncbi:DUF4349 domain-containing protein [Brevundimonas sp. GCM10030266]|uniref:DUF4349 domain-containing protein n=1 Tax=Brevundimonas sp. GCM10030266 TaxID=3273386 RepID=UPI00360EFAC0
MRRAILLACAGVMALSACGQATDEVSGEDTYQSRTENAVAPVPPQPAAEAAAPAPKLQVRAPVSPAQRMEEAVERINANAEREARVAPPPVPTIRAEPVMPVARIAYAFTYALAIPKERGAQLMSEHEYACVSAGPELCQVVSAEADWTSGRIGGHLELRGQPDWINRFRAKLALDAANAGGRMDEARTEGEDVTRGMDEAATGAATTATLADRINTLQQRQGATMAQRMQIERELAELYRLQNAQEINLRELNSRVQSARLTIDYRENGMMAASSPTRPVAKALQNAMHLSMGMLAALITVGSLLAPIGLVGGAIWWIVRRLRRRTPVPA